MEKELISVIVPVYNIEDYIAQCIESILKQTYSNLEILLVNDGSTDCCPEICDRYAGLDSRIQVIHKSNGGLSSARNSGLNQACGEYIAFIDGDDFIHPEMLEDLYFALKDCDADMSVCNLQYVDENGNPIREYPNHIIPKQVLNAEGVFAKSLERYGYYYVVVWNKLYKKELWETYRFREGKAREDEFSFHHIVRNCRCISCVPNVLYYYVQHTGSIMAEKTAKIELDVIEAYLERMSFFLKENHLQFLVQMDKLCFITLCETKKICKKQKETPRYLDLMRAYQILHGQIAQKVKMPFRIKLKRAVCKFFPYSAELYGKIKETAKEIWYGLSYLSILHQATRIHIFSKHKPCIYLIATPAHGNLGDQAIVYAQYRLLEECGYKKNIIEITRASYEHLRERLKKLIRENDLIIIDGGGNLGTLWIEEEWKMRDIVLRFPKNPVFIFPQTAFYETSHFGKKELRKSAEIYSGHGRLILFCRDKITYQKAQSEFSGVNAIYTPDMVPFLQNAKQKAERAGVLLCLRQDLESVQKEGFIAALKGCLYNRGIDIKETSTLVEKKISKRTRVKELKKKWKEFSSAEFVITDRLHGMIFCAVTATPCIALDNVSHKVRDGYEWLSYLPYLNFCEAEIESVLRKVELICKDEKEYQYNRECLEPYYKKIKEEIRYAFEKK